MAGVLIISTTCVASGRRTPMLYQKIGKIFFKGFELGRSLDKTDTDSEFIRGDQAKVDSLMYQYRSAGHYIANIDPLQRRNNSTEQFCIIELWPRRESTRQNVRPRALGNS